MRIGGGLRDSRGEYWYFCTKNSEPSQGCLQAGYGPYPGRKTAVTSGERHMAQQQPLALVPPAGTADWSEQALINARTVTTIEGTPEAGFKVK